MLDSVSSPYARIGPALVSNGYSAIPIMPGSKRPGTMSRGRWYGDLDWTRFSDRLPTDIEVGVWKRYPDAGICVVLGGEHNVVAIDVDTEDGDEVEALRKIIPKSPVAKRGAKGYTAFFRAAPQIASRPFDTKHGRAVDLLCRGKQTVVAPTLHPETGLPYMWLTDSTLEHISPERLPMLPDDIAERIAEALAPFGYVPGAIRERGERTSFGGDVWDDVKAEALLRLDQWVPHLGIDAHRKRNGNWRGVAVWRGGKNCNVGFDPTGIVDFKTGEGITAIDVVMRALDMEDHEALDWLKSKLGFEDAPESEVEFLLKPRSAPDDGATDEEKQAAWEEAARLNFERLPAEQRRAHEDLTRIYVRARLANGGEHPRYTEEVAAELGPQYREAFLKIDLGMFYVEPPLGVPEPVVEAPPRAKLAARSHPLDGVTLGNGVDWTLPSGILGSMSGWIMATARRPNRPLAVAASVAVLSTLCGRHLYGPTGTALNLYIVCLAETSVGKDRPFKAVYELLDACGYGRLHQTAKIFSVTGFEQLVAETPACTAAVDELATNLLARISNKKASNHETAIKGALQELWSRSIGEGPFETTRRAAWGDRGPRSTIEIPSPSLTLFGASTPQAFYSALTSGNVEDGFMNRFLIAPAAPRAAKAGGERAPVPSAIADALRGVPPVMPPPGKGNITGEPDVFSPLAVVDERALEWTSADVGARADAFEEEILAVMDAKPPGYQLLGRVFESTVRLASLHAVSREGSSANVGLGDIEWGAAWALESARSMMDSAATMMARNDHEEKVNAVSEAVRSKGEIPRSDLLRTCRHINAREMEAIIKQLVEAGIIRELTISGKTNKKKVYAWLG